jgi:hypothetical protein
MKPEADPEQSMRFLSDVRLTNNRMECQGFLPHESRHSSVGECRDPVQEKVDTSLRKRSSLTNLVAVLRVARICSALGLAALKLSCGDARAGRQPNDVALQCVGLGEASGD